MRPNNVCHAKLKQLWKFIYSRQLSYLVLFNLVLQIWHHQIYAMNMLMSCLFWIGYFETIIVYTSACVFILKMWNSYCMDTRKQRSTNRKKFEAIFLLLCFCISPNILFILNIFDSNISNLMFLTTRNYFLCTQLLITTPCTLL